MMEKSAIRQTLNRTISQLNPSRSWPVNLHGLLRHLGLTLRFEEKTTKGAESILQLGSDPTIVVYRQHQGTYLSSKERFSIAHELAHWVVWRRFGFLPSSETYWDHETLCNEFAAELLVPTSALNDFLDRQHRENVNAIYFPSMVKRSASVSWDVAAKKIAAVSSSDLAYLQLREVSNSERLSAERHKVFKVSCSTVTNKPGSFVGQQGHIRAEQDFLAWMDNLQPKAFERRTISLTTGNLQLTNVHCALLRETDHWVIHFSLSSDGVRISSKVA